VAHLPRRAWDHSGKRYGSTVKAERELGFRAQVGIDTGLAQTVEWTRTNLPLIRATIAKHEQHMRAA
jgi:nucleoside-diphosphate-sugar epimerase